MHIWRLQRIVAQLLRIDSQCVGYLVKIVQAGAHIFDRCRQIVLCSTGQQKRHDFATLLCAQTGNGGLEENGPESFLVERAPVIFEIPSIHSF